MSLTSWGAPAGCNGPVEEVLSERRHILLLGATGAREGSSCAGVADTDNIGSIEPELAAGVVPTLDVAAK